MTAYSASKKGVSLASMIFLVMLLILYNAPQMIVFVSLSLYFIFQILIQKKVVLSMPGWKIYLFFLLAGTIIGLISVGRSVNQSKGLIRHIYYFLLVGLSWYFGYDYVTRKKCGRKTFLSCFVVASSIRALIIIITNAITVSQMGFESILSSTATNLRGDLVGGSIICTLGLYILIFYPQKDRSELINKNWLLLVIFHIIALFFNFSRTAILDVIILVLFSGLRTDGKTIRRIVASAVLIIVAFYIAVPSLLSSVVDRIMRASTEMNFWINNWSEHDVVWNWRGYEAHCEFISFLNSNLLIQLFGNGFGASLSVGKYAYLVTGEGTLPFLHNGYFTQLMIFGLSGVVFLIYWLISMYRSGTYLIYKKNQYFVHGIVVMVAANAYIDHGFLFSCEQATVFCLVGCIFALNQFDKYLEI